ncbi:type II secretion system F family protein [Acetobacterium carbinolicum]|uniref:type II secretion system F family protein n=1 Tax=Acetobacterium TaxID=33951 RepID=UPI0013A70232|nr:MULTISPECIES: type II secretion system F family protein [unclassified Acetobacterium]MDZ5724660.1 type II secretion system F family protein [Acetobacterium sp. K1/6]
MMFLAISVSALLFVLILIIFYNKASIADTKKKRLNSIKKRTKNDFDDEFEKPFFQRVILPVYQSLIKKISSLFPQKSGATNKKTETNLKLAGLQLAVNEYNAIRIVVFGGFFIGAFIVTLFTRWNIANELLFVFVSMLLGVVLPVIFLKLKIKKRQGAISNELPDIMDILCVTMEAGLGFDSALIKIGERLSGVLVVELNIVHTEINFGKPRKDALKSLADRNSVEELKTFVGSIIQAEQLGIPINHVLKAQSEELRIKRRQRAEEKAMKAPVKMMIPLVFFVLPVLFIVLLGPTILQLVKQFA